VAGNLKQIGDWTLKGFNQRQENIALFLKLTRKDINQLMRFPLPQAFVPKFKKFCMTYGKLEEEYKKGIVDHRVWATGMQTCAQDLQKQAPLV
jgi:hypothetical protein